MTTATVLVLFATQAACLDVVYKAHHAYALCLQRDTTYAGPCWDGLLKRTRKLDTMTCPLWLTPEVRATMIDEIVAARLAIAAPPGMGDTGP